MNLRKQIIDRIEMNIPDLRKDEHTLDTILIYIKTLLKVIGIDNYSRAEMKQKLNQYKKKGEYFLTREEIKWLETEYQ
jgi:hypothetical protein